jgi:O-antigen ligase
MQKWLQERKISIETISAIFIIIFASLFVLADLTVGFIWPLFVLAMAIGFGISAAYPRSGVLAIIFLTMVWERFFTLQTFFIGKIEYKIYPVDFLLLGIFVSVLAQYVFSSKKMKLNKIDWILAGFVFLNAIYFIFSYLILKSDAYLAFSSFKNYAFYSLIYFAVIYLFRDRDDLRRLFRFFLAGAVFLIGFVLIGFIGGEGLWSGYTPLSTSGVRKLAFTHGLYLTLAFFPVLLSLLFEAEKKSRRKWLFFLLLIWAVGIVGTLMRHLWIAMAGVSVMLAIFLPEGKRKAMWDFSIRFALPFVAVGIFVFYALSMDPQSSLSRSVTSSLGVVSERAGSLVISTDDESFSWRSLVWKGAYERFKTDPIFGIGTGEKIYVEDQPNHYKDYIEVRNIHNSYLAILIQLGSLGLAIFLLFVLGNVKALLFSKGDGTYDFYKYSILSVLGIYLLSIPFQPYLETNLLAIFFWMSLGLARILPEMKDEFLKID